MISVRDHHFQRVVFPHPRQGNAGQWSQSNRWVLIPQTSHQPAEQQRARNDYKNSKDREYEWKMTAQCLQFTPLV